MRRIVFPSILALAVPVTADTAAGDCAPSGLAPSVLNGTTAADVDGEGGIVVAAIADYQRRTLDKGDPSVQTAWQFSRRGKKATPKIDTLAPGLSTYRAPPDTALADAQRDLADRQSELADAKLKFTDVHPRVQAAQARVTEAQRAVREAEAAAELVDDKGKVLGSLRPVKGLARTPAAKVKAITFARNIGRRSVSQVAVTLDGDPPADVVAMILADAKGTPRSWTVVDPKATPRSVLYPFRTHSCEQVPNGTVPSAVGDKVIVYWVDAAGRRSDATKPLAITAAP